MEKRIENLSLLFVGPLQSLIKDLVVKVDYYDGRSSLIIGAETDSYNTFVPLNHVSTGLYNQFGRQTLIITTAVGKISCRFRRGANSRKDVLSLMEVAEVIAYNFGDDPFLLSEMERLRQLLDDSRMAMTKVMCCMLRHQLYLQ